MYPLKALGLGWLLMVLAWGQSSAGISHNDPGPAGRPNVLLILTDDQRYDSVGDFMPQVQARIFDQGVQFTRGYVTTSICCPSRASILTGLYAHHTGVRHNADDLTETTFMERLHAHGYFTGMIGKYLNSWDGSTRPEYDFWVAFPGVVSHYLPLLYTYPSLMARRIFAGNYNKFFDPILNVNGTWRMHKGYTTAILRDYARRFLDAAAQTGKPFALLFSVNAPHHPAHAAPGEEQRYRDLAPHRPPSYNEADVSDKPGWLQWRPPLSPRRQVAIDDLHRRQLQTLWSLDEAIGAILAVLEQQGRLDETAIFFISDNGLFWGEHRLMVAKNAVYEEAIRVPFALRYPPAVPSGRIVEELVANIDIAPTIYQLAGVPTPSDLDGLSLLSLLQGTGVWRDDLLIEGWPRRAPYERGGLHGVLKWATLLITGRSPWAPYAAVHTGRHVYVETEGDRAELYDLETDPYQLDNKIDDPAYAEIVIDMRGRLRRLRPDLRSPSPAPAD